MQFSTTYTVELECIPGAAKMIPKIICCFSAPLGISV